MLGIDKTKDAQSDFDTGLIGLKIDFLNLVPTWSLLNRSSETFNPLGAPNPLAACLSATIRSYTLGYGSSRVIWVIWPLAASYCALE